MYKDLDRDNIKCFAMFKYKGKPKDSDLEKILNLYNVICERKEKKNITIFDYESDADTIVFDENGLWACEDGNLKISNTEEVLGYLLGYMSNYNEIFIIVRELGDMEKPSTMYGYQVVDKEILAINTTILENMNRNSLKTCGLNPENNIKFIELKI